MRNRLYFLFFFFVCGATLRRSDQLLSAARNVHMVRTDMLEVSNSYFIAQDHRLHNRLLKYRNLPRVAARLLIRGFFNWDD